MRQEKIYVLNSIEDVKKFAQGIYDEYYYVDSDGECWKGDDLKEAICNSSYDYDVWLGEMKEIVPYEFFYVEQESAFLEYRNREIDFCYSGDSWECDICTTEKEALESMIAQWEHLTSWEKSKKSVFAYRCFAIPEYIGRSNFSKIVGYAAKYRNNEYISNRDIDLYIIDKIDDDISGDLCPNYIVFDGVNYFYEKEIDDVHFRVEVSRAEWEGWQEIFLEHRVEVLA